MAVLRITYYITRGCEM